MKRGYWRTGILLVVGALTFASGILVGRQLAPERYQVILVSPESYYSGASSHATDAEIKRSRRYQETLAIERDLLSRLGSGAATLTAPPCLRRTTLSRWLCLAKRWAVASPEPSQPGEGQ